MNEQTPPPVLPWDSHNQKLVSNVHPLDWKNPTSSERYNLVIIGGGTAGLVSAIGAAGLRAKVAAIGENLPRRDCRNVRSVPSQASITAARAAAGARGCRGVRASVPASDAGAVGGVAVTEVKLNGCTAHTTPASGR